MDEKVKQKSAKKTKTPRVKLPVLWKVMILNFGNVLLIIAALVLIGRMPSKAEAISESRVEYIKSQGQLDVVTIQSDLDKYRSAVDELKGVVSQEDGLLGFISKIDELKSQGRVAEFSILTNDPVIDAKTKNSGIPIQLVLRGNSQEVSQTLKDIQASPFLMRPVTLEVTVADDGNTEIKYGSFIYMNND